MAARKAPFVLLGLSGSTLAAFGPAFSTGPVASGSFIREATSTLIVPSGNFPFGGDASLWVGMGTSNGDLVQAICNRHPGGGTGTPCEDITTDDGWCGFAYTLEHTGYQAMSTEATVTAGDHFEMHYVYNDDTQQYDQYAVINGNTVSTLSTSSGLAQGWGSAVECAATDCGTIPAHEWINTVITMDVADPNYGHTAGTGGGASTSGFTTADGGKTWTVNTISIPEFTFT